MTTMTTEPKGYGYLSDIPQRVVERAQQDMDFSLRLLNRETREDALNEPGLDLTEDELGPLLVALDDIAGMSFREALRALKGAGINGMA
jgi:hypothetical protein